MSNENIVNGFDFGALPIVVTYVGKTTDENKWEHYLWNVNIKTASGFWTFPYRCGLGHVEKKRGAMPMPNPPYKKGTIAYSEWFERNYQPKKPSNSDIMYSIMMDSEAGAMSFNDWCSNYDYSNDSMKAFKIYQTCCEYSVWISKAFSRDQIEQMRTALEGY